MHEFRIGSVFADTFKVLQRNWLAFAVLALIVQGLDRAQEHMIAATFLTNLDDSGLDNPLLWAGVIFGTFLNCLLLAPLTYGTYRHLQGRPGSVMGTINHGLALVPRVFMVSIILVALFFLGILLLVVPVVFVMVFLWVPVPVAVIERPGTWACLLRSVELSKGHRWKILGIHLVFYVPVIAVTWAVTLVSPFPGIWNPVISDLTTAASLVLFGTLEAVGYFHLRRAKEGVEIAQIAAVFD